MIRHNDTASEEKSTINLNWQTRLNILTSGYIRKCNWPFGLIRLTGRHASQRNKKLKHLTTQIKYLWLPTLHRFAGCPTLKAHANQPPKEFNFTNALFDTGFRAVNNYARNRSYISIRIITLRDK